MKNKEDFRKFAKIKRNSLYREGKIREISNKIQDWILNSDDFKKSNHIMTYIAIKDEIDLSRLFFENKNFYIPRCKGKNLEVTSYKIGDTLIKSNFGTMEATGPNISPDILDIIIVPCLAADKRGYRLGYGCGFYDRFLKDNKIRAKKIVVVPDELYFDEIPADEFDEKCDLTIHM